MGRNGHHVRISTQSWLRRRKFSHRSCWDSNLQPFWSWAQRPNQHAILAWVVRKNNKLTPILIPNCHIPSYQAARLSKGKTNQTEHLLPFNIKNQTTSIGNNLYRTNPLGVGLKWQPARYKVVLVCQSNRLALWKCEGGTPTGMATMIHKDQQSSVSAYKLTPMTDPPLQTHTLNT